MKFKFPPLGEIRKTLAWSSAAIVAIIAQLTLSGTVEHDLTIVAVILGVLGGFSVTNDVSSAQAQAHVDKIKELLATPDGPEN